jgi:radical SAM protein with 4Fe4S-binding SPASM domain
MSHRRLNVLTSTYFPAYVVWELTLQCDHACTHCGSRAGVARPNELRTEQALEVVKQLADMHAREVVLIGGEAYLHPGFLTIVRALKQANILPTMTSGGRGITPELAASMVEAGLDRLSISIDGLQATHDRMRALRGSFQAACDAVRNAQAAGAIVSANTNINRLNRHDLTPLYEHLKSLGISAWQVQITTPLGRAADRTDMLLQPWDLLEIVPELAELKRRAFQDGILIMPGNNLGYFGPEEALLRSLTEDGHDHWAGCQAGKFVLGIESDGAVKGCPSLQTTSYVGGNLESQSLQSIWDTSPELGFARRRTVEDLWGYCKTCVFAETCLGGCSFTAHALFGKPGNNPYCHYRARSLAKQGKRERLVPAEAAPGTPFDNGLFTLVEEDLNSPEQGEQRSPQELVQITRKPKRMMGLATVTDRALAVKCPQKAGFWIPQQRARFRATVRWPASGPRPHSAPTEAG